MHVPEGWELILVLLVIVVVFGSKRLPDSARALGRSMRILKAETKGLRDDDTTTTTARVGTPLPAAQPVQVQPVQVQPVQVQPVATQPVHVQPVVEQPAQPYSGQQLFDAEGRPVHVTVAPQPVVGSQQVQPSPQS